MDSGRARLGEVATYLLADREGVPWADDLQPLHPATTAQIVQHALDSWRGWYVSSSDEALAQGLLAVGAASVRHAHVMRLDAWRDLNDGERAMLRGVRPLGPDGRPPIPWEGVLASWWAAYPRDHPDWRPDDAQPIDAHFVRYTAGAALGPLLTPASAVVVDGERAVAGLIVVDRRQEGPWVVDVWRDPVVATPGTGSALLLRAAPLVADLGALRLAVTVANDRAVRAYKHIGFTVETTAWTLRLPD